MSSSLNIEERKHIITGIEEIDKDVYILSFKRKFDFYPGEIIAITIEKDDDAPRLYSVCSGTDEKEMKILFNLVPKGKITGSLAYLKPGDSIYCSSPYGRFHIKDEPAYWIATGTGIAPFISKILSSDVHNKVLLHGGRDAGSFYFSELLKNTAGLEYVKCSSTLDDKGFYKGRITEFLAEASDLKTDIKYYLCGRAEMIVEARDILISKGIPYNMIESEIYF